jgi:hypothetical protein
MYAKALQTGSKTYHFEKGRIFSLERNGFGDVITQVHMESTDERAMEKVWAQFHDIFTYGQREKLKEIHRAMGIRN